MKPLSGLDASFLYAETQSSPMHVIATLVVEGRVDYEALHPHGPLLEGVGLNVTVLSYAGSLDVGVLACRERVPDAHRLADGIAAAFEELAKLADAALPDVPALARQVA